MAGGEILDSGGNMPVRIGQVVQFGVPLPKQVSAGIVTHVWSEYCVNLWVVPDGTFQGIYHGTATSVMRGAPYSIGCWWA